MSPFPSWSHAILEPSYQSPLLPGTTQQQRPTSTGAHSPSSSDDLEYIGTTTTTRQVTSGSSHSLSTNSSQYGYGLYDDDEDEENDEVENDEEDERFAAAAALEIEQMEEDYIRQQQQQQQHQQQQQALVVEEDEVETVPNPSYPLTAESYTEAVPAGVESENGDEEALTFMVPEATYTTRVAPFIHLEIQELRASQSNNTGLEQEYQHRLTGSTLPRPRQFIFEPNTRLLLGRAPSSGLDPKARLKQLSEVGKDAGQARAENGHDDGLFANQVISKLHAAIFEKDGQLVLEDWESTHGTFVNEEPVSRRVLHDLDHVRLGRAVTRRDIHYKALEFVVRIQNREYYEHPSARAAAPADLIAGNSQQIMDTEMREIQDNSTLDNSPSELATLQSQTTVILVDDDDDFDEEERADFMACTQTQVASLDVQEPLEKTPTEEQDIQEEAQYVHDAFQGMENNYEGDEDEPDAEYDDDYEEEQFEDGYDAAFEQPEDDYEEQQQPESEEGFQQQQSALLEDKTLLADNCQQREQEKYDVESDDDDDAYSLKAAGYALDDHESKGSMTHFDLTHIINPAAVPEAIKDDEDLPIMGEAVIKETSTTSTMMATTVAITTALPMDVVVEENQGNHLKRKHAELEVGDEPSVLLVKAQQEAATPKSRKTALIAAALAGVVVGSVGTVLTLANI
ncbi:hypothetical protein BGZ96_001427 [Linnemannia gamsii]|uniref:FHA domain-containing protein n=1 Tax=Linnemannia gamsii TaxID=64522 RepID=A0ABQ7JMM2_9FUNG|nr:hypothetical protein BGZ96_001427 [Linnemannia gamsii]